MTKSNIDMWCTRFALYASLLAFCFSAVLCQQQYPDRGVARAIVILIVLSTIWFVVAKGWWKLALISPAATSIMTLLAHSDLAGASLTVFMAGMSVVIFTLCIFFVDYQPVGMEWVDGRSRSDAALGELSREQIEQYVRQRPVKARCPNYDFFCN